MNNLEIEIKARIDNPSEMKRRILEAGAVFVETEVHEDIYYNHPSRDLKETDEAFRIRTINGNACITYKGPKIGKLAKSRVEREVTIGDLAVMRDILSFLGFTERGRVAKKRGVYSCSGLTICLDSVESLGDFIEIEKIGDDLDSIEAEVMSFAGKLGITEFERRSYIGMILSA